MSSAPSVAVIDLLNSLLEGEQASVFRFMGEGSPYLTRATADVRRPLQEMMEASQRREGRLCAMIESLGGFMRPRSVQPEEQYLAFLSLKFLLPKLVTDKQLCVRRYENALRSLRTLPEVPGEVNDLLESHAAEVRNELKTLQDATDRVLAEKRT